MTLVVTRSRPSPEAPRRTLLYGVEGVGKSTWASQFPAPIFLPTEDGLADVECEHLPMPASFVEARTHLELLATEKHEFRAVVIDTVDALERLIWDHVCAEKKMSSIEDIGYAKGYRWAMRQWAEILERLTFLRAQRGMEVVLVAHAAIEKSKDPTTEAFDRWSPKLNKHAQSLVLEWCDEVLFAGWRIRTAHEDQGFNQRRTRAIASNRVLHCEGGPAWVAKHRLECLPPELEFEFEAYSAARWPQPKKGK